MNELSYLENFRNQGYVLWPHAFAREEVDMLRHSIPTAATYPEAMRVLEEDGVSIRTAYGVHQRIHAFHALTRDARLVNPAREILGHDVCVYQSKVNSKAAFAGSRFDWHQDFAFWHSRDRLPAPKAVTAALFLDTVTHLNGPLFVLPGSHKEGLIDAEDCAIGVTALRTLSRTYETIPIVAPSGSLVFFDCNLVHASPMNMSPFDRAVVYVTYNDVANRMPDIGSPSPEFLAGRDYSPLLADDQPLTDRSVM